MNVVCGKSTVLLMSIIITCTNLVLIPDLRSNYPPFRDLNLGKTAAEF